MNPPQNRPSDPAIVDASAARPVAHSHTPHVKSDAAILFERLSVARAEIGKLNGIVQTLQKSHGPFNPVDRDSIDSIAATVAGIARQLEENPPVDPGA